MKNKKNKAKKIKECPYCSFFKPCGNCYAKKRESESTYLQHEPETWRQRASEQ